MDIRDYSWVTDMYMWCINHATFQLLLSSEKASQAFSCFSLLLSSIKVKSVYASVFSLVVCSYTHLNDCEVSV